MSSGYGRFVAALGGLVAALALIGVHPAHSENHDTGASNTKSNGAQSVPGDSRESLALDREANRIAERANIIAEAQRGYALWQLGLGAAGVIFTGFAAFFAWRATHWAKEAATAARLSAHADNEALEVTRAAADEARKDAIEQAKRQIDQLDIAAQTASAMRETALSAAESNQIARESAERQLRAYITVDLRGVTLSPGHPVEVAIQMFNRGQTPARNITVKWGAAICPIKPSRDQVEAIHASAICPEDGSSIILGPNEDRGANAGGHAFDDNEVYSVLAAKGALCVVGSVEYIDAFDRQRRTRFCHIYIGGSFGPNDGQYCHYGNDYT